MTGMATGVTTDVMTYMNPGMVVTTVVTVVLGMAVMTGVTVALGMAVPAYLAPRMAASVHRSQDGSKGLSRHMKICQYFQTG